MNLFVPSLQALLDGNGDTITITSEQVTGLQSFLNALVEQGDPELQAAILSELERHPLENMAGATMGEAWAYLNGYQLEWLPPISNSNPYSAQQGSTIPVKFTITDFNGNFVTDESVALQVLDANGSVVVGPIPVSNNPNNGIKIQGSQYHYNLKTKDLPAGSYTLRVTYNSLNGTQAETRSITLTKKK
ncbi:MAG: PxKF domain-containing protein [Anaerolineales bacterium]|nr:PxKF domain-containing protein [Anaerolineales bacterium]